MPFLPLTAAELARAETAALEMEQIMAFGARVGLAEVIPPVDGYTPNDPKVAQFYKSNAAAIIRREYFAPIYASGSATVAQAILQSVPYNTVNFNATNKDTVTGITTGSNWVYRAQPGYAGLYHVSTLVSLAAGMTEDFAELSVWKVQPVFNTDALEVVLAAGGPLYDGNNQGLVLAGNTYVELAEGEGLRIKVRITDTSDTFDQALSTATGSNWIRIQRVADIPG